MYGVGKFCTAVLSRKQYKIGLWLLWNINRKSYLADQSVLVPMSLRDLEGQDMKCQTFPDDLCNYAPTVAPRANKFGTVTHVRDGRVSVSSDTPRPKAVRPSVCQIVWDPLLTPIRFELEQPNLGW